MQKGPTCNHHIALLYDATLFSDAFMGHYRMMYVNEQLTRCMSSGLLAVVVAASPKEGHQMMLLNSAA